jgi:polar amino acid transport system substrate-binding protein
LTIAIGRLARLGAIIGVVALVLAAVLTPMSAALAQGSGQQKLRVVTRVLPPLVVEEPGGKLAGFSIELWESIAARLKLETAFQVAPNVGALLADMRSGKADVGVAAVSITSAREAEFDFTQPILNAGLQIMVRGRGQDDGGNPFWDLLGLLFSSAILVWLGIALLLIVIPAHIVWYLEKDCPGGIIPTNKYYPGIFYALQRAG